MMESKPVYEWDPARFGLGASSHYTYNKYTIAKADDTHHEPHPYVLLILNSPINNLNYYKSLYNEGTCSWAVPNGLDVLILLAIYRVCADGGANQVAKLPMNVEKLAFHYVRSYPGLLSFFYTSNATQGPDAVCGDMDSVTDETRKLFHMNKYEVFFYEDRSQYATDFMKSLRHIEDEAKRLQADWVKQLEKKQESDESSSVKIVQKKAPPLDIVVLGGLEGRADQAFSQVHHLYEASKRRSSYIGR